MEKYFKNEILRHQITKMIVKTVISAVFLHLTAKPETGDFMSVASLIIMFLMLYSLLSLFQFCISLTGNYIIGAVVGCGSVAGIFYLMTIIEENSLFLSLLAIFVFFLLAIITDIVKLISILKIKTD